MAKREKFKAIAEFAFFDVTYEDGTRTSNRKVPNAEIGGLDGDSLAKPYIEAEDRRIGDLSGRPRGAIKSIVRSRSR